MESETYCDKVAAELAGWRTRLGGILKKFDEASCCDKAKLVSQLKDLNMLKEELDGRIELLETMCLATRNVAAAPVA
jgi:hypothetical protein